METITEANRKGIREFAYEAFSHILSVKLTDVPEESREILQNLINILSEEFNGKMHCFTKPIFKSVCVTEVLLKEYFAPFFTLHFYNHFSGTFINDFKLILLHWLQQRDNVFVKIIDSLAIFTEAFVFCIWYEDFPSNMKNTTEGLINLFEEIFPSEFFHKGGWGRLNEKAEMWYQNLYSECCIKEIVVDYCKFVSFLRKSTVMFPVPQHWLCEKCKIPQDESMTRQITYVIPDYEFLNFIDNKSYDEICSDLEKVSVEKRIECVKNEDHFIENEKNTYVERKYSLDTGIEYVCAVNDPEKDSVITVKCSVDIDDNSTKERIGNIDADKIDVDNGKQSIGDGKHTTPDEKVPEGAEKVPEGAEKFPEGAEKFPEGAEKFPEGAEKFPVGAEKFPVGAEKFPEGAEKDKVKETGKRGIIVKDCGSSNEKFNVVGNKYSGKAKNCVYTVDRYSHVEKNYRGFKSQNLNVDKKYGVPLNVSLNIEKQFNILKCESAGKEFIDNVKVSSDAGKQAIVTMNASHDSNKNLSKDEQGNNSYSKDKITIKEIIHLTAAAISKPYNSDSTLERNQNLLEELIGNACNTGITKNHDFWFIAEKYSHSVEKMLREVLSLQSTNIDKLPEIIQEVITSYYNIPNLDGGFFFSMAHVFVSIGGTKSKTKRGNKNRKKNLLKEL